MSTISLEIMVSIVSALVAFVSVIITFFIYKLNKLTLHRYDHEIDFIKRHSKAQTFLEIRNSIDNMNNKIVDWDLDFADIEDNDKLTSKDKKLIAMALHSINLAAYSMMQNEIVGYDYVNALRTRLSFNIRNSMAKNKQLEKYIYSLNLHFNDLKYTKSSFGRELSSFLDDIVNSYDSS